MTWEELRDKKKKRLRHLIQGLQWLMEKLTGEEEGERNFGKPPSNTLGVVETMSQVMRTAPASAGAMLPLGTMDSSQTQLGEFAHEAKGFLSSPHGVGFVLGSV